MSKKFTEKIGVVTAGSLNFTRQWNKWYRVLRYGKGFGLFDSLRHGLWLARG